MHGSKAHERDSSHTDERMGSSGGRRFVWERCRTDKQSLQEDAVAVAFVAAVVAAVAAVAAERRTRSGQESRTKKRVSVVEGSVLCREATEHSSKRADSAVVPVLDLETPLLQIVGAAGEQRRAFVFFFFFEARLGQTGRRKWRQCRQTREHITSQELTSE